MAYSLQRTAVICLVFLLGLLSTERLAAIPPASLNHKVALTAWLDVEGGRTANVIVEITVNGTKDWGRPDADGRVELMLPADAVAMISFRKPGHLTKMVSVDTHHMQDGDFKGKQRNLSFGVILDTAQGNEGLTYAGPVGVITFHPGDGGLVIEHDQQLVPEHQQKVVF